jgi:hypothetical protein
MARTIAALFTAGAIRDLTPFLLTAATDPAQPPWAVPQMRDASHAETSTGTDPSSTVRSSARRVLMGERPGLLPVRAQRHVRRPVRVQLDPQHLVQLDLVPVKTQL